jgi:hypothetical protein
MCHHEDTNQTPAEFVLLALPPLAVNVIATLVLLFESDEKRTLTVREPIGSKVVLDTMENRTGILSILISKCGCRLLPLRKTVPLPSTPVWT